MALLIADSGSTKTDWCVHSAQGEAVFFKSQGLNPYFEIDLKGALSKQQSLLQNGNIDQIKFFGAGCGNPQNRQKMQTELRELFPQAEIFVESDLYGAALACHQGKDGIAVILGTGSSVAVIKDQKLEQRTPSLGYLMGDELAGSWLGKELLSDYYYGNLEKKACTAIEELKGAKGKALLKKLYSAPYANRWLAELAPLYFECAQGYQDSIFTKGSYLLYHNHLAAYEKENLPVSFVGSIACRLEDKLTLALKEKGLKTDLFLSQPLNALLKYYA